jgi:uncharacterized protein (TIRG00374 family)
VTSRAAILLLCGLALTIALAFAVDVTGVFAVVASARPVPLLAALVTAATAVGLAEAIRLQAMFAGAGLGFATALRITFVGLFAGSITPGAIGAEAYRLQALSREGQGLVTPLVKLALLRTLGVASIVLVAAAAMVAAPERFVELVVALSWPMAALPTAALGVLAVVAVASLVLAGSARSGRVSRAVRQAGGALASLRRGQLAAVVLVSVAATLLRGLSLLLLVQSCGGSQPFTHLLVLVGVSVLASVLPISVGGLGVQEGVIAGYLAVLGMPADSAVAVALLSRGVSWVLAAAGGTLLALGQSGKAKGSPAAPLPPG